MAVDDASNRHQPLGPLSDIQQRADLVDPDPFTIGLAVFQLIAAGATFLEQRHASHITEGAERQRLRAAWFSARRSMIFFVRQVEEFESYILEEHFQEAPFRIGSTRLFLGDRRKQTLQRLRGQVMTTAIRLGDDLDELSNYLTSEQQPIIADILGTLHEIDRLPERYGDLIIVARRVADLYNQLLQQIDIREGFTSGR